MLASLFLSQGTPMLLAGDELGRTQKGNNNAYCQDNELSWIDWTLAESDDGRALIAFVARLIALRHRFPVLRSPFFLHGQDRPAPDVIDIAWFDEAGQPISTDAWNNPLGRMMILRRAAREQDGSVPILTSFFNASADDRDFKLPPPSLPTRLLIDSADPAEPERPLYGDVLNVKARSVALTLGIHKS
jgi:glycogen operon protein